MIGRGVYFRIVGRGVYFEEIDMGVYFGGIDRSVYFLVNENWWIIKSKRVTQSTIEIIHHPSFSECVTAFPCSLFLCCNSLQWFQIAFEQGGSSREAQGLQSCEILWGVESKVLSMSRLLPTLCIVYTGPCIKNVLVYSDSRIVITIHIL